MASNFANDTTSWYQKRYTTTPENLEKTLEKYGVAIIPNVLDEEEIEEMKDGMWTFLEEITSECPVPINRDDVETYHTFREMWNRHSMLIQLWGIGHSRMMWTLRENPKIIEIFAGLWEVDSEELLVSFDGASFHIPPELDTLSKRGRGWLMKRKAQPTGWLHTDQGWGKRGKTSLAKAFECIQSWVTAFDVRKGDATLKILEGSHSFHEEMGAEFNLTSSKDWHQITPEQHQFYLDRGCKEACITCPAGSMVFWDSRTIHSGQEPLKGRPKPNFRLVGYLCYTPRELATPAVLKRKIKAYEEGRTTNHWPHKPKLFPETPYTRGAEVLPFVKPCPAEVGEVGQSLAGY